MLKGKRGDWKIMKRNAYCFSEKIPVGISIMDWGSALHSLKEVHGER